MPCCKNETRCKIAYKSAKFVKPYTALIYTDFRELANNTCCIYASSIIFFQQYICDRFHLFIFFLTNMLN